MVLIRKSNIIIILLISMSSILYTVTVTSICVLDLSRPQQINEKLIVKYLIPEAVMVPDHINNILYHLLLYYYIFV